MDYSFLSMAEWRTPWRIQLVDSQICIGSLFRFARVRDLEMGDLFCISPDQKPFWQRQFLHQLTPLTLIRRGVSQESPFKGGNWNERFVVIDFSQPSTQMSSFSQEVTSLEKLLQNIESWKERGTPCFHPFKRDTGSLNLVCPRKWPNHRKRAHWQLCLYVKRVLPAEVENISLLGFRVAFVAQQRSGSVQIYFNLHPDIILIPLKENQLSSKWTKTPLLDGIWGVHRGWIRSNLKLEQSDFGSFLTLSTGRAESEI